MKRLVGSLIVLAAVLGAQAPRERQPQWEPMFNGKDLAGWVEVGHEKWTVEDGVIRGQAISKEYGYLRTGKSYKDFEMTVRFKWDSDGNSGVFFHTDFKPGTADVSQGLQFEIDSHMGTHTGGIYGDGRAWVAWPAPENETAFRPRDWNDMYMKVVGNRYICRLNGVTILDFTDPTPKSFDGYIALQLHSGGIGNILFRDLYIRDLTQR